MTDPQQQRELIEDLTARTGTVAEAANRAVDGLPAAGDELVSAVIAQLRSVNDECQRIHGVLERVSAMIAQPAPPAPPVVEPQATAPPPVAAPPPPPPPAAEPPPPPVAAPPPPPPPPPPPEPAADPYGPPPGSAPPEEAAIAVPSGQFTGTPEPVAYEGTGVAEGPPSEGIRLLATQMAVAGETVGDIERRLRTDFGVTNAAQVVRELFGPSGDHV